MDCELIAAANINRIVLGLTISGPPGTGMNHPERLVYRMMAREYHRLCAIDRTRKVSNAVHAAATVLHITKDEALKGSRSPDVADKRHVIIAFACVVTGMPQTQIAHALKIGRPAIRYAVEKYGDEIKAALDIE